MRTSVLPVVSAVATPAAVFAAFTVVVIGAVHLLRRILIRRDPDLDQD